MATDGGSGLDIGSDRTLRRLVSTKKANIVRPEMKLREAGILMAESQKNELVAGGGDFVGIVYFATADGSKIEINREKLSVKFNGEHVIMN